MDLWEFHEFFAIVALESKTPPPPVGHPIGNTKRGGNKKGGNGMINTNIYNYINVLDKAADAANTRNEVIVNNLANDDTPGYKRKDVSFQTHLEMALFSGDSLDDRIADINTHLSDFGGLIYTDSTTLSYRLDGNNVDVDTESAMLAENQIRYNTLVSQIQQEFSRYKTVLST